MLTAFLFHKNRGAKRGIFSYKRADAILGSGIFTFMHYVESLYRVIAEKIS